MPDSPRRSNRSQDPSGRSRIGEPLTSGVLPKTVECPHCQGSETELFAAFGSALSVSQYYCRVCRTVFEYMKWA